MTIFKGLQYQIEFANGIKTVEQGSPFLKQGGIILQNKRKSVSSFLSFPLQLHLLIHRPLNNFSISYGKPDRDR